MNQVHLNPHDPKYRCCCNGCHVTTGTKILAYIFLNLFLFRSIAAVLIDPESASYVLPLLGLALFCIISPLYGIHAEKPMWIIPFLVGLIIYILKSGTILSLALIARIEGESSKATAYLIGDNKLDGIFFIAYVCFMAFFHLIALIFNFWFFFVAYRCYQYLSAKNATPPLQASHDPPPAYYSAESYTVKATAPEM